MWDQIETLPPSHTNLSFLLTKMGLPQTSSGLAHPVPNLNQLSLRIGHADKIRSRVQFMNPEFRMRAEYLALLLVADLEQFDDDGGSLSIERNVIPTLKRKLEVASPFCKHCKRTQPLFVQY